MYAVEGVNAHLVVCSLRKKIPTLMEQLNGIGADGLHIPLCAKLLITQLYAVVAFDGREDGVKVFKARRYIL